MEGRAEKREARRVYTWGMEHAWGLGNQNAHDLYIRRGMELELREREKSNSLRLCCYIEAKIPLHHFFCLVLASVTATVCKGMFLEKETSNFESKLGARKTEILPFLFFFFFSPPFFPVLFFLKTNIQTQTRNINHP